MPFDIKSGNLRYLEDLPTTDEFRACALGYWSMIAHGDSRHATAQTEALALVVDTWRTAGVDGDHLLALLSDHSREVRYAAAAFLGPTVPSAVAELRRLAEDPMGLVAPTAKLLLVTWSA